MLSAYRNAEIADLIASFPSVHISWGIYMRKMVVLSYIIWLHCILFSVSSRLNNMRRCFVSQSTTVNDTSL